MRIYTPTDIKDVAWEGVLVPSSGAVEDVKTVPSATVAEPAWWPAETLAADLSDGAWPTLNPEQRYVLLRLCCSLHPPRGQECYIRQAAITAALAPYHAVPETAMARDLYPHHLNDRGARKFDLHIDKWLRFNSSQGSENPREIVGIEYIKTYPVIQGYGAGKSSPYWRFTYDAGQPLVGCQSVYVLVEAPDKAGGVRVDLQLMAEVQTPKRRCAMVIPANVRLQIRRNIDRH